MNIDINTLTMVASINTLLQVMALFVQWRLDKTHRGPGWWLLGMAATGLGFAWAYLRAAPQWVLLAIVGNNLSFVLGRTFMYVGVLRFLGRRERRGALSAFLAVFTLVDVYFTYVNNDIVLRRTVFNLTIAALSFLGGWAAYRYKSRAVTTSANLLSATFVLNGLVFVVSQLFNIFTPPDAGPLIASVSQLVSLLGGLIATLLTTFGFILLINQRLNTESREARDNLELIFNTSPDAVLITRVTDGYFVRHNEGFTTLTGYTRAEVLEKSTLDVNIWKNPADRQRVLTALNDTGVCDNLEIVFQRKDGLERVGIISAKLLMLEGVPHIISVTRDITDRKQTEQALRASEEKFRDLADLLPQIVFETDLQGRLTYVNKQALGMLGYPEDFAFQNLNTLDLYIPEDRARAIDNIQRRLSGQLDVSNDYTIVRTDGARVNVLVYSNPILKDMRPIGLRGLIVDITQLKQTEAALHDLNATLEQRVADRTAELQAANARLTELDHLKDEFLSRISHELRTPLSGILISLELLEIAKPEKRERYLQRLKQSADRMRDMIEDVLMFSQLNLYTRPQTLSPINLNDLIASRLGTWQKLSAGHDLQLQLDLTHDLPHVRTDGELIGQAINRLVINAINYTPAGSVIVSTATRDEDDRRGITISVADTGPGITPDDLPHIFERFYRGRAAADYKTPGTGIGLAICHEIAQKLGGKVTVQTQVGVGSTFTLWLPAASNLTGLL